MLTTWLQWDSHSNIKIFNELVWCIFFFINYLDIILVQKNTFFLKKFIKSVLGFKKIQLFFNYSSVDFLNINFYKAHSRFQIKAITLIPFIDENWSEQLSVEQENITPQTRKYFKSKNAITWKILNLFFLFSYSIYNHHFQCNQQYKLFYIKDMNRNIVVININKVLFRWVDAYTFLFNIFFYEYSPLLFSSPIFKKEILALNWHYAGLETSSWKYFFPFFVFRTNSFGSKINFFLKKLENLETDFYIITDCSYHFKNLHNFKVRNFFTFGLIGINLDPWLVSYALPSFLNSDVIQFFFLRMLLLINKISLLQKYIFLKNFWANLFFKKISYLV